MFSTPLKQQKKNKEKEQKELFKKDKCVIKANCVKKLTGSSDIDEVQCRWVERWIDTIVRENSYPPQLRSNDFYSLLASYLEKDRIIEILDKIRMDFAQNFPMSVKKNEDDNLEWLSGVLKGDVNALKDLPTDFLN